MSVSPDPSPASHPSRHERVVLTVMRSLLVLYPRAFRQRFGDEMLEVVRDQWREEAPESGARWRLLLRTASDLVRQAARQRIELGVARVRASRRLTQVEAWADAWALLTTSLVWVAFVGALAQPGFEWGLFGAVGSGRDDALVSLVLLTALALALPIANGCLSLRIQRGLRTVWLGFWTVHLALAGLRWGLDTAFQGDAWGVRVSVLWLLVPTGILALATALKLLTEESALRGSWRTDWKPRVAALGIVLLLVPLQWKAFAHGEVVVWSRLAVAFTLAQWLLVWLLVFRPPGPWSTVQAKDCKPSDRSAVTPSIFLSSEISP